MLLGGPRTITLPQDDYVRMVEELETRRYTAVHHKRMLTRSAQAIRDLTDELGEVQWYMCSECGRDPDSPEDELGRSKHDADCWIGNLLDEIDAIGFVEEKGESK